MYSFSHNGRHFKTNGTSVFYGSIVIPLSTALAEAAGITQSAQVILLDDYR
ncbi:MAG: hypothetical protein ACI9H6_000724 [Patiriisocius sp.]|jgi:hypothetical protein